jgi:hypothetical protein
LIGLIRILLRFVWLALFILGVRRAAEIIQGGAEDLLDKFEADQTGGLGRTLTRLHEALHRVHAHESNATDALGEM